jgi:hypothetical protein
MREWVVPGLVDQRGSFRTVGSGCLEGFNDQRNGGFPSVALHLDSYGLFLEYNDDHLVAQPVADVTQAQHAARRFGQPDTAILSKHGVNNFDRARTPHADHGDGATAFCR